mgnify:FL=1|tara:strand:+ start:2414 stop:2926 length:513 start_codon:yes stop_codon:yes gene_type:complete
MIKVIDNFLPENEFNNIRNVMLSNNAPWHYSGYVASKKEKNFDLINHYYYHMIFEDNYFRKSMLFETVIPILDRLDVVALKRIKANFYPQTKKIYEHKFHRDYLMNHRGALFSINTNNGSTIFKDGTKIKSVANRLLKFNPAEYHKSTTCNDSFARVNITINYFKYDSKR